MTTADNVFETITVWANDAGSIEIRGNGIIAVEDYDSGKDLFIRINNTQMKAIARFLMKSAKGMTDGIGTDEGGVS